MAIKIPIITEFDGKGISKAIAQFKQLETNAQKLDFAVKSIGGALAGGAALQQLTQFGMEAAKAAVQDQQSQALLADQLRKTAGASQDAIKANEEFITGLMRATNVADDELRPALGNLVRGTKDVAQAQQALATAVDISKATGRDLESVSIALSKAAMGNVTALQRLGVPLSDNVKKSKDFGQALKELDTVFGGAAATAADTLAGKLDNLSIRWKEQKERIGYELLPVMVQATDALQKYMDTAENTHPIVALGQAFADLENYFSRGRFISDALKGVWNNLTGAAERNRKKAEEQKQAAQDLSDKYRALSVALQGIKTDTDNATDAQSKFQDKIDKFRFDQQVASMKAMLDALDAAKKKTNDAKAAFADLGKSLRADLASHVENLRTTLKNLGDQYAQSITSSISLGSAWDKAKQTETAYNDALKERTKAYDDLAKLNPVGDAEAYAKALDDVRRAEVAVRETKAQKVDYKQVFADQIAAAKEFATNLKTLVGDPYNLGKLAVSQLLNMGPVAGNEAAKAIMQDYVTGGLSPDKINSDLNAISGTAKGFGATAANLFGLPGSSNAAGVINSLDNARVSPGGRTYQITVNAGIADKKEVARQIVEALKDYEKTNGSVPIKVRG